MGLRERQIGGIPLTRGSAAVVTLALSAGIPIIAYNFWFPLFGIPEEMRKWLVIIGIGLYLYQCVGRVPPGVERAQLFFGIYTGESFSSGIYLLPRVPFPVIALLLTLLKEDISKYLGWILEGDVSVESIVTSFFAEGLTSDGIRVNLKGKLVFEVVNAAVYLSQRGNSTNKVSLEEALQAETASSIKQKVIAKHSARNLFQGDYEGGGPLNEWVTEACSFVKDFGLHLARSPIVEVSILNERIQNAFDAEGSKSLLRDVSNETAEAFRDFVSRLPQGTSEEVALAFFNTARMNDGLSPVSINVVKFK